MNENTATWAARLSPDHIATHDSRRVIFYKLSQAKDELLRLQAASATLAELVDRKLNGLVDFDSPEVTRQQLNEAAKAVRACVV